MEVATKAKKIGRLYRRFRIVSWVITAALVAVFGWQGVLIFVVLPQVMALLTFEATYDHHSGLYRGPHGGVAQHHVAVLQPRPVQSRLPHRASPQAGVHWTRLPELHAELEPRIPAALIAGDDGMFASLLKGIFRPRSRAGA